VTYAGDWCVAYPPRQPGAASEPADPTTNPTAPPATNTPPAPPRS
jgi:hypothetical protein